MIYLEKRYDGRQNGGNMREAPENGRYATFASVAPE